MTSKQKAIKGLKSLAAYYAAIRKLAPADENKIYKIPKGGKMISMSGEQINDTNTLMLGIVHFDDDTPETVYVRKFKALQVKIKHLAVKYLRTTKQPGSTRELMDICKIYIAVKKNQVNEDTIKLARKYFDIPPIKFENFN